MDYKNLDTKSLNQLLINSIGELQQQGLVDDYFRHCHSLKEENGPFFFVELIPVFLADARKVVNEMAKAIDQSLVDYNQMYVHCIKLKGSAACIGACRLRNACTYMSQAIDDKSRDRRVSSCRAENLGRTKQEIICFSRLSIDSSEHGYAAVVPGLNWS
ncbi:histidine-containing phosphotransfer protein 2-like isoform X1 [Olea europaea var. sylvestris]|uniref:histidine-containing phosphotransfer protein 2-like isoform X1 n=1 Tax=Olea europaea var. sylvestris TaxID=158386 RepID=UPI000C1D62E7|nr:histidine-containing phosphotransfer protein 2-like isoform X1 [Olea europaea var. sylvestris]